MSTKAKKGGANDASRFEGNGVNYRAKLIGIEDVPEARGDQMCQEVITKLKNSVKISGQHKRKIFVNITLEGLKIIDAISLAASQNKKKNESKGKSGEEKENEQAENKESEPLVLHTHAVHRISFISRDTTDNRAFGYIYGEEDGQHKFFAIKTASAAEQLVLALRDLFQVAYEMKKKEMDEKLEKGESEEEENSQTPGDGSTSGTGQTPQTKANAEPESIYQVPPNNAPVKPRAASRAEQVANLLDLEDQADHILKDIEHIKNLEFDTITSETSSAPTSPPTSPMAKLTTPSAAAATESADPWGLNTVSSAATPVVSPPASSAMGDLAGLQTSPFPSFGMQQSFANTSFGMQQGFGAAQPGYTMSGLPVTKDPFANDPFGAKAQQPQQMPGGFGASNPFGAGFGQQPYGMQPNMGQPVSMGQPMPGSMGQPQMMGMMPGIMPHGMVAPQGRGGMANPFAQPPANNPGGLQNAFGEEPPNLLQPVKKDEGEPSQEALAKPRLSKADDLFGDLLEIKKSAPPTAKNPKDMFAQINASEKKSLNELKTTAAKPPAAPAAATPAAAPAPAQSSPFGDLGTAAPAQPVNGNNSSGSLMD